MKKTEWNRHHVDALNGVTIFTNSGGNFGHAGRPGQRGGSAHGTATSGVETNGKIIADVTGAKHQSSDAFLQKTPGVKGNFRSIFHSLTHSNPGKAATDAHDYLSSEAAGNVTSVTFPKPKGRSGWSVTANTSDGDVHHFTFLKPLLSNSGTSDGVKKGWETRKGGASGDDKFSPEVQAYHDKFADRNFAKSENERFAKLKQDKGVGAVLKKHAKSLIGRDNFDEKGSDSKDFSDQSVVGIREALSDAHKAGGGKGNPDMTDVAQRHLDIPTLKSRNMDSLDFHDTSHQGLERALIEAYHRGKGTKL